MKIINSRQNPHVKTLVALRRATSRRTQGKFIAEGIRVVSALVSSGWQPLALYATEKMLHQAQALLDANGTPDLLTCVTDHVMEKISTTKSSSGLLGVFTTPFSKVLKLTDGLVLAKITDPGNTGTLIRTCAAMNRQTVIIVDGCDPWSPKVVQASAGTIGNVVVHEWDWDYLIARKGNATLNALVVKDGSQPQQSSNNQTLLVVGNEAHGIPNKWLEQCDTQTTLAMPGKTESLNAAVAGSIALYTLFSNN